MTGDGIHIVSRQPLHRARKYVLERVAGVLPDGRRVEHEVVRHGGSAVILPVLAEAGKPARVVMVRTRRLAVAGELLELPAGTLDADRAGGFEDPLECARRELAEETGYFAATWRPLSRFYPSPGMTDELMHGYLATELTAGTARPEADEDLRVELVEVGEALRRAREGELTDGKTILLLLLAERLGVLQS